jgi:hypothetical protein
VDERFAPASTAAISNLNLDDMRRQISSIADLATASSEQMLVSSRSALTANTSALTQLETQLAAETTSNRNDAGLAPATEPQTSQTQVLIDVLKTLIQQQQRLIHSSEQQQQQQQLQQNSQIHHHHHQNNSTDVEMRQLHASSGNSDMATPDQLPPIRARNIFAGDSTVDDSSLLILDGRSIRVQPDQKCMIKYFYTNYELFCDTRTKEIYLDAKRVAKMGDPSKEISLGGRKCRLMYMGRRCELWIDGVAFTFRADSPPKQVSVVSPRTNNIKRYYVTVDSRTMLMFFNNYKVCLFFFV